MKVSYLKEMIKHLPDDGHIFVAMFEKEEAEEHLVENLNEGKDFPISNEQWQEIVENMDRDECMWEEITNCWSHYIEKLYNQTKEGKINDSGQ